MSALQIVLLSVAGAFTIASIVFMIMFIVEITVSKKEKNEDKVEVKSIFSSEDYVSSTNKEQKEETIDSMLAKLDEQAVVEAKPVEETKVEEVKEETIEEKAEETVVEEASEVAKEVAEIAEGAQETVEAQETAEETQNVEVVEDKAEENAQEVVETQETTEETTEEAPQTDAETSEESAEVDGVKVEEIVGETISVESLPDYKARLDKIIENRDKINKDLIKVEKSILNYERTKRRKTRNQKMLDRRASELTNLNLVMYSVTDIKNVDEDKKVKQEELTSHIAELKASIQDAEEFLDSNKEKNEHDVKMAKFLIQEKARYNEEITELQKLIAKTEGNIA